MPTAYEIEIRDEFGAEAFPSERVSAAIADVLSRHDVELGIGVTFVITSDEEVRTLNSQFRGVDAATDILSFPADPLPDDLLEEFLEEAETPYLGDLIMAYPYTASHAAEAGHDLDDELVLLAIHGTLHLLGYDHDNAANQDEMWAAQDEALHAAGVAITVTRFTFED